MKVTLRERHQSGKISLYLDYYHKGKRKAEYLSLYLNPKPKSRTDKELNKKTKQLAESIRAQRLIEIQNGTYGFNNTEKQKGSFIDFVELQTNKRYQSQGNYGNWGSMLKHLKNYTKADIPFSKVDKAYVEGFRDYLDKEAKTKQDEPLSQNSKYPYDNKFRAALKQAVKDEYLLRNPSLSVTPFSQTDPEREFLTFEELQSAANTKCEIPILKTAFIFSCLTGLRWSDIHKLIWSEVQYSESMGYYIRFRQKKTKDAETLPISDQAYSLMGESKEPTEKVFRGLQYSSGNNHKLQLWMRDAGITKHITFHCARHTHATLLLTKGADLYTVSKMLGHKNIKTTQVYAKIVDNQKREAANSIKLDL